MSTVTKIADEIEQKKKELADLEKQLEAAKAESEDIRLARQLHDVSCYQNHTDGCGWYYEFSDKSKEDWNGHAHAQYLGKARKLMRRCKTKNISTQDAIEIFKMVRE